MSNLETYQNEIIEYLSSKLSIYNVPKYTIMEIAQYCMSGTLLVVNDEVRKEYKKWNKQMERNFKYRGHNNDRV
jgi:hypothetical protein